MNQSDESPAWLHVVTVWAHDLPIVGVMEHVEFNPGIPGFLVYRLDDNVGAPIQQNHWVGFDSQHWDGHQLHVIDPSGDLHIQVFMEPKVPPGDSPMRGDRSWYVRMSN